MKIAIVSKLWESTDPHSTGGTGLSVGLLADELVKRGHKVTVFGTGDSKTKAKLISVRQSPWENDYSEPIEYLNIAQAFSQHNKFDIIHCHVEYKAAMFADLVKTTPHLMSIRYGQLFADEIKILKKYRQLNWSTNSGAMTKLLPFIKFQGVVYNGLDLKRYPFNKNKNDYLLFLARLSPQKGPDTAISIAKKLGRKLILAGKIVDSDKPFLTKKVLKQIDGRQIQYVGEVKFTEKIKLLKNASALIYPNIVFEACSNAILEAQACGTPVIAFDKGSNKELILNNKTGFVVKNSTQMAEAIKRLNEIDPQNCRQHIIKKFSVENMANGYEKLYLKLLKKPGAHKNIADY